MATLETARPLGYLDMQAYVGITKHNGGFEATDELSPVVGRVASADLTVDPALVVDRVDAVRIFRGYAGWGPGQLEGEIEQGAWLVLDAEPDDVFDAEPDELWRSVLRRQGGRIAWLASAPDDLSAN